MALCAVVAAALAAWCAVSGPARRRAGPAEHGGRSPSPLPTAQGAGARGGHKALRRAASGRSAPPGNPRAPAAGTHQRSDEGHAAVAGPVDASLLLDLCATLLQAGLPVSRVLRVLSEEVPGCEALATVVRSLELSIPWSRAWSGMPSPLASLGESLAFAHLTGAATATMLREAADQQRRADVRAAERRAAELGVRLVVPLGVCALPAFICLGIVPVVISLLPDFG
jgi:hypothetical protein